MFLKYLAGAALVFIGFEVVFSYMNTQFSE